MPLAATYSDITFSLTTASRQGAVESAAASRFARQVQRVSVALQSGAEALYPDLASRVPDLPAGRFDVYVVDSDAPGSVSSANGRIALSAALGSGAPCDACVAFVIAREMGHVIARHHSENSSASIATSVILNVVLPGSGLLKSALSAGASKVAAISKQEVQSSEADALACSLLKAARIPLDEVSSSLLRIAPASPDESAWSKNFRKSSVYLLAESRRSPPAAGKRLPAGKVSLARKGF